jgi:phage N-6-adenine-methyltransferase
MTLNPSLYSSSKTDWGTPQFLFDRLNLEFNFDLDVCAVPANAKCKRYFTPEIDGLKQEWWARTAWLNPPYGRGIDQWVKKAWQEAENGHCKCVALLPVRSDTKWWHHFVMKSNEIRLLTRRLTFEGAGNKAPFPAAIVVEGL